MRAAATPPGAFHRLRRRGEAFKRPSSSDEMLSVAAGRPHPAPRTPVRPAGHRRSAGLVLGEDAPDLGDHGGVALAQVAGGHETSDATPSRWALS